MEDVNIYLRLPIEVSKKGLQTFTLDMDEYELHETGVKTKNGKPVNYMVFKFTKK